VTELVATPLIIAGLAAKRNGKRRGTSQMVVVEKRL